MIVIEVLERDTEYGTDMLGDPLFMATMCGSIGAVYSFIMCVLNVYNKEHENMARDQVRVSVNRVNSVGSMVWKWNKAMVYDWRQCDKWSRDLVTNCDVLVYIAGSDLAKC